ncbi:TRM-domain-containing protein [Saccharata proteae CBS 121410]|uniref:tRNA (guanine(26)-N(2))-dimethyltransferase n=1 Tax=Saccharata proteae CBS 121410 TaxID=1314787 RepID=A0A9P4LW89_9PEZI|nr:TRM-domain-containing protein [Saccharata proteae CBS 121410]
MATTEPQSVGVAPATQDSATGATSTGPGAPVSITALPSPGQLVQHEGRVYTTVKEGLANILIPPGTATTLDPKKAALTASEAEAEAKQQVFYNPIQQFNRDLSVLAIRAFGEDLVAERRKRREREAERERRRRERVGDGKRKIGAVEGAELNGHKRLRRHDAHEGDTVEEGKQTVTADVAMGSEGLVGDAAATGADSATKEQDASVLSADNAAEAPRQTSNGTASKGPRLRILDALSASGLRALRYSQELPFNTTVTGNDLSPAATAAMRVNIKHNRLEDKITPVTGNALAHMYSYTGQDGPGARYDVIDLDPYGTAVPFLDAAVQAVADGGLLCVTCTDAGVWASHGYLEKTYSQYGGLPIKGLHSHEGGLRLILHAIATAAARYGISIEPLLSLSIDFYARVFVRVRKSAAEVKFLAGKTMLVYNCDAGCGAWETQYLARNIEQQSKKGSTSFFKHSFAQGPSAAPRCAHCGFKTHLSGPMYGGPLHNPAFIEKMLAYLPELDRETYATTDRIEGMLTTAYEETLWDDESKAPKLADDGAIPRMPAEQQDRHPFYFVPSALAKVLHCQAPSEGQVKGALRHLGYRATRSHTKRSTIRTDAPWEVVWEVMREWVRQKAPLKEGAIKEGSAGWGVMQRSRRAGGHQESESEGGAATTATPADGAERTALEKVGGAKAGGEQPVEEMQVVFDEKLGKDRDSKRLVRYQQNPRANWGPMNRAK